MRALPLLLLLASPCYAQALHVPKVNDCYTYVEVAAVLAIMYGEVSTGPALVGKTAVENFINEARRSLTTVEVYPSGLTCYRAIGDDWGGQPRNMTPG